MLRHILTLAANDVRMVLRARATVVWMVLLPIVFVYVFGSLGGGDGEIRIGLTVVDQDSSPTSSLFVGSLQGEGFEVSLAPADSESLASSLRCLLIPRGLQDSLLGGSRTNLLFWDPSRSPEAGMGAKVHLYKCLVRMLADVTEAGRRADSVAATSAAGVERDSLFLAFLHDAASAPELVEMRRSMAGKGRPVPTGTKQSFPGTLTFFMILNPSIYGAIAILDEKRRGILARTMTAPLSRGTLIVGKLSGRIMMGLVQAGILIVAGRLILGAFLGHSVPGMAMMVIATALAAGSIALFWGAVLSKPEQGTAVALVVSLLIGALGGCWWPLEIVPSWLRTVGHISPAAWAMDGFNRLISFGEGVASAAPFALILLLYAVFFSALGAKLMRISARS